MSVNKLAYPATLVDMEPFPAAIRCAGASASEMQARATAIRAIMNV